MILRRIINSSFKTRSKVIIGVRSTVCYIQLLFILKIIQAVFSTSTSVLYRMTTRTIHVLSMRFKRQWSVTSWIITTSQKVIFFLMDVGGSIKITKTSWIFSPQTGLWFRCRMDFLCQQPWQVILWWDWWLSKMPCCKKKFAKTNEQSDSRLSGNA